MGLRADGGEARQVLAPEGGVEDLRASRDARTVVMAAKLHRDAGPLEADAERGKARTDAGVAALLFESYPIRHWDHYVGPRERHLLAVTLADAGGDVLSVRDLTPDAGPASRSAGSTCLRMAAWRSRRCCRRTSGTP